jgi:hypothetical protein
MRSQLLKVTRFHLRIITSIGLDRVQFVGGWRSHTALTTEKARCIVNARLLESRSLALCGL